MLSNDSGYVLPTSGKNKVTNSDGSVNSNLYSNYMKSMKNTKTTEDSDVVPKVEEQTSTSSTPVSDATTDAYWNAVLGKLNSYNSARDSYLNSLFANQRTDANGYYSKLARKMLKNTQANGQDPYVTNAWNVAYAKDKTLRDIDQNELEAKASNSETDYSKYNSLYNSLLNSNASDETKRKYLLYA